MGGREGSGGFGAGGFGAGGFGVVDFGGAGFGGAEIAEADLPNAGRDGLGLDGADVGGTCAPDAKEAGWVCDLILGTAAARSVSGSSPGERWADSFSDSLIRSSDTP